MRWVLPIFSPTARAPADNAQGRISHRLQDATAEEVQNGQERIWCDGYGVRWRPRHEPDVTDEPTNRQILDRLVAIEGRLTSIENKIGQ
jgi:hypothetical protein